MRDQLTAHELLQLCCFVSSVYVIVICIIAKLCSIIFDVNEFTMYVMIYDVSKCT